MSIETEWISTAEAQRRLGLASDSTVRTYIQRGLLRARDGDAPTHQRGRPRRLVHAGDVEQLRDRRRHALTRRLRHLRRSA